MKQPLAWLTSRPIAHRGLHDASAGVIENTASALHAAVAAGYGLECDVQMSRDGEAMVHHDETLCRLIDSPARVDEVNAAELKRLPYRNCADRMLTLGELCDLVGGRVPMAVEIKSRFHGDMRLTRRVAETLAAYKGPVAAMSFDPAVLSTFGDIVPALARGIVAERHYAHEGWKGLGRLKKFVLAFLLHTPVSRPHFIAYRVADLPSPAPLVARAFGFPLLTWTVRTPDDRRTASAFADQMIFEGFRP